MATQRLTVPEIVALGRKPNDPCWDLPAVAVMRDGSDVYLARRRLRQAHDEMRRDEDADVWFGVVNANDMADWGVFLPNGHEAVSNQEGRPDASPDGALENATRWAQTYAAACEDLLAAATACLEPANLANGASNKICQCQGGPQLPGGPRSRSGTTSRPSTGTLAVRSSWAGDPCRLTPRLTSSTRRRSLPRKPR